MTKDKNAFDVVMYDWMPVTKLEKMYNLVQKEIDAEHVRIWKARHEKISAENRELL